MQELDETRKANGETASGPVRERLESWKEIAAHLNRGVTTVQRWEQEEGLPVHRLPHAKKGSVFAFSDELDDWRHRRAVAGGARPDIAAGSPIADGSFASQPAGRSFPLLAVGALLAVAVIAGVVAFRETPSAGVKPDPLPIPRPFANEMGAESSPSLSPDGRELVYDYSGVDGIHALYIRPVRGGPPRALVLDKGIRFRESGYPSWSPRGDLIAFLSYDGPQRYALHVVARSGGPARRLTSMAGIGLCWHPDGSQIGFIDRTAAGEPFSVFSISLPTGARQRLTYPPPSAFGDTYCSISPDGMRIAVVRHATRSGSDLYVAPLASAASGALRKLTTDGPGMTGVAWTLDGASLVVGWPNGLWRVPVADVPTEPELVAGAEHAAVRPSVSRSNRAGAMQLAYEYVIQDVNIWRFDSSPDGARRSRVIPGSTLWEDFPAFSPNGDRIAFVSNRTGEVAIWTALADGSHARQLTFHRGIAVAPQWSPDGRRIVFALQNVANWDVYVIGTDGTGSSRLTWESSQEENPSWSRDGRWIYFRSDRSGRPRIWKIPSAGGAAVPVTAGEASQAYESTDGRVLYFVRSDDAPGLWSMPVAGGPESFVLDGIHQHAWSVVDGGIVFIPGRNSGAVDAIRFFDVRTRASIELGRLPASSRRSTGFSATRDGRHVSWAQTDVFNSDIMVIDNWKP